MPDGKMLDTWIGFALGTFGIGAILSARLSWGADARPGAEGARCHTAREKGRPFRSMIAAMAIAVTCQGIETSVALADPPQRSPIAPRAKRSYIACERF